MTESTSSIRTGDSEVEELQISSGSNASNSLEYNYRRALAYWREMLSKAAPVSPIIGRRRAPAPAGMGCNRGPVGILETRLYGIFAPRFEHLLASYVLALKESFGLEHLIIDRWFCERDQSQDHHISGPSHSFYPLIFPREKAGDYALFEQIVRLDAAAQRHCCVDTLMLGREFGDLLRERNIALSQFGFGFINLNDIGLLPSLDDPLDAIARTPHEIQLTAAASETGLKVRLTGDLDIVSQGKMQELLELILVKYAVMLDISDRPLHRDVNWSIPEFPKILEVDESQESPAKLIGSYNVEREIPITSTQMTLLTRMADAADLASAETAGTFGLAFAASPPLDRLRLKNAIDILISRHEIMRTRFVRQGDAYHAYLEREPSQILYFEEAASEAAATERAYELLREGVRARGPIYRVVLIDYGAETNLIVNMAHHIGMDGHSLGLIVEEAFQAYLGMPLPVVEMDIDRFVAEFDHIGNPKALDRRNNFLRQMFVEPPPVPHIGRKAKSLAPNHGRSESDNFGKLSVHLSAERRDYIRMQAQAKGTTETAMVMAAYASTLAKLGGVDEIILSVPYSRRHSRRLEHYANFVSSEMPVRVRPSASNGVADLAAKITSQIEEASQYAPFVDALWIGEFRDWILSQGSYTRLYLGGEVNSRKWSENTISGALQRPNVKGEIVMGPVKLTILPGLPETKMNYLEMELRSFSSAEGLAIIMNYDTVGFTPEEARLVLDQVVEMLEPH